MDWGDLDPFNMASPLGVFIGFIVNMESSACACPMYSRMETAAFALESKFWPSTYYFHSTFAFTANCDFSKVLYKSEFIDISEP